MLTLLFNLLNIFWLIPLLLIPVGMGNKLLRLFDIDETPLIKLFYAYALGIGFYSYAIFLLGIFHLLYPGVIALLIIASLLITFSDIKYYLNYLLNIIPGQWLNSYLKSNIAAKILLTAIAFVIVLNIAACLVPATDYDDVAYHLAIPKHYVRHHGLTPKHDIFTAVSFPQFMELNNIYGLIFNNESIVRLRYFLTYILLCVLIYSFARTIIPRESAIWAVGVFVFIEDVAYWAQTAHVDITMAFYSMLVLFSIINWVKSKNIIWLYFVMLFSAFLLSIKYTGLTLMLINLLVISIISLKYRISITPKHIVAFILILFIFGSPFYILNYLHIGTVFFPYFGSGKYFNLMLNQEIIFINPDHKLPYELILQNIISIFTYPWRITIDFKSFGLPIGPIFLAVLPLYMAVKKRPLITFSVAYAGLFIFLSYFSRGIELSPRLIMPIIPFLCFSVAYVITEIKHGNRILYRVIIVYFILFIIFSGALIFKQISRSFPYLYGKYDKLAYLSIKSAHPWGNKLEYISMYDYINKKYRDENIKLLLDFEMPAYYLDADYYDPQIMLSHKNIIFNKAIFNKLGITHRVFYSGYWAKKPIPLLSAFTENGISYQLVKKINAKSYDLSFYKIIY